MQCDMSNIAKYFANYKPALNDRQDDSELCGRDQSVGNGLFDDEGDIGVDGDDGDDGGDVGDTCDDGGGRDKEGGC